MAMRDRLGRGDGRVRVAGGDRDALARDVEAAAGDHRGEGPEADQLAPAGPRQLQRGADPGGGLLARHLGHLGRGPGEGDELAVDRLPRLRGHPGAAEDERVDQGREVARRPAPGRLGPSAASEGSKSM